MSATTDAVRRRRVFLGAGWAVILPAVVVPPLVAGPALVRSGLWVLCGLTALIGPVALLGAATARTDWRVVGGSMARPWGLARW
ncbi:hypothetical protein AB0D10_24420 [Kitasatospora sp. NPDC048545]|uniref:hypothetical protein n=1 Tax=Kitasatospora sp. NPDC048545 TaxID=3157208 RepID=UPI0033F8C0F1